MVTVSIFLLVIYLHYFSSSKVKNYYSLFIHFCTPSLISSCNTNSHLLLTCNHHPLSVNKKIKNFDKILPNSRYLKKSTGEELECIRSHLCGKLLIFPEDFAKNVHSKGTSSHQVRKFPQNYWILLKPSPVSVHFFLTFKSVRPVPVEPAVLYLFFKSVFESCSNTPVYWEVLGGIENLKNIFF